MSGSIFPGNTQTVNGKEYATCMHVYDLHSFCISFRSQATHVRRYGKPQDCTSLFSDWKKCLTAKAISDPEKKQVNQICILVIYLDLLEYDVVMDEKDVISGVLYSFFLCVFH